MTTPAAPRVRTRTDDDDGLRLLVEEHSGPVFAYLVRAVDDRGRAEDLLQEVFLRAWRRLDTWDAERGPLRGWLLAIARNLVIDAHRADQARPRSTGRDAEPLLAAVPARDEVEPALAAWSMAAALERLTPAHRAVLTLLYYRRLSIAEAAAELQVPPGTVKSRSTYALRALRLVLEEMELS